MTTGEPVWRHRDAARFWDSHVGAGPRGTPAYRGGRVYTFGATGIVNALDAADGTVVWSRNAASDTDTEVPGFGFTSSPLVVDDVVIVAVAGRLVAYDAVTGDPRWFGPEGGGGYSSPHLLTIAGVAQVLLLNGAGATSVAPGEACRIMPSRPPPGKPRSRPGGPRKSLILKADIVLARHNGARSGTVAWPEWRADGTREGKAAPGSYSSASGEDSTSPSLVEVEHQVEVQVQVEIEERKRPRSFPLQEPRQVRRPGGALRGGVVLEGAPAEPTPPGSRPCYPSPSSSPSSAAGGAGGVTV